MTTQEEYNAMAQEMKMALEAARTIPANVLCPKIANTYLLLKAEDYRAIASGLFIQANINSGNGRYEGPVSKDQIKFIKILGDEREEGAAVIIQFLNANRKDGLEDLTSSMASTLIDTLKELPKRK